MWWTGITTAKSHGFVGFKSICDLRATKLDDIPKEPGVYLILRPVTTPPVFLPVNKGGHFKGKDPTVEIQVLNAKWVKGSIAVYVGKAGGDSSATLRSRLAQYLRFGEGKPVGHWGGRYIWQLGDCESLLVCWKVLDSESPLAVEQQMLDAFCRAHGQLPFANCRR